VQQPFFASGGARQGDDRSRRHEHLYGHSPLAQALDTLLALHSVQHGKAARLSCLCATADNKRTAVIEIREPRP
jgi:hypothetical protein